MKNKLNDNEKKILRALREGQKTYRRDRFLRSCLKIRYSGRLLNTTQKEYLSQLREKEVRQSQFINQTVQGLK